MDIEKFNKLIEPIKHEIIALTQEAPHRYYGLLYCLSLKEYVIYINCVFFFYSFIGFRL